MRYLASFSAIPSLVGSLALLTLGCGGDEFVPAPSATGGSAGAAGAAGGNAAGAAGKGGTEGGAAGAPQGGAGGASGGQAGVGGATGGAAGVGGGGANAGTGGAAGGSAGNAGTGGGSSLPAIGAVSLKIFPDKGCTGDSYKNPDNGISLPQGAGDVCVMLSGAFFEGDAVKIDGDIQQKKLGNGILTTTWSVPHGGGLDKRSVTLEIIRENQSTKLAFELTPRTAAESGSDTLGLGTTQRPWKTLQKALAGATKDTIALAGKIDPGVADPNLAAFDLPAGATVTAAVGATASIQPIVPFTLRDGSRIAKLTIDCEKVLGPCVQPVEGGSTVEDVVMTAKEGGYAVLKAGVKLAVVGGKVTSPAAFLHTGAGSTLRLAHVDIQRGTGTGICGDALRVTATPGKPSPILEMDPGAQATTITGFDTCFSVATQGDVEGVIQNLLVNGGGTQKGTPAVIAQEAGSKLAVRSVILDHPATNAIALQAASMQIQGLRIIAPGFGGLFLSGGKFEIEDVEVTDSARSALALDAGADVRARGKVKLSWAASAPLADPSESYDAALRIDGTYTQIAGPIAPVLLLERPPLPAIRLLGKADFLGTKGQADGLQVKGARASSFVFEGKYALTCSFGAIDTAIPPSLKALVVDAREGEGKASFDGLDFSVEGSKTQSEGVPYNPPPGYYSNVVGVTERSYSVSTVNGADFASIEIFRLPGVENTEGDVGLTFNYPK